MGIRVLSNIYIINKGNKNMVTTKKINSPAKTEQVEAVKPAETVEKVAAIEVKEISKKAGSYDSGYGAPKDHLPSPAKAGEGYQVPGVKSDEEEAKADTTDKEEKDGYDRKYVEPKSQKDTDKTGDVNDEDTGDKEDYEECTHCKGAGKMKKSKHEEPDGDEEEEKVVPKKAEKPTEKPDKSEHALDFGNIMPLLTPTKEELDQARTMKVNKNEVFGVAKKQSKSVGRQMTEWAMTETTRLTQKKV